MVQCGGASGGRPRRSGAGREARKRQRRRLNTEDTEGRRVHGGWLLEERLIHRRDAEGAERNYDAARYFLTFVTPAFKKNASRMLALLVVFAQEDGGG
jgi:hypothetical protein